MCSVTPRRALFPRNAPDMTSISTSTISPLHNSIRESTPPALWQMSRHDAADLTLTSPRTRAEQRRLQLQLQLAADSCSTSMQGLSFGEDGDGDDLRTPGRGQAASVLQSPPRRRLHRKRTPASPASASGSPSPKHPKLERKAKLELFAGEPVVPADSFYRRPDLPDLRAIPPSRTGPPLGSVFKPRIVGYRRHASGRRVRTGEINFGVRHAVRRPKSGKRRDPDANGVLDRALALMKNSPLNSYIEEYMRNDRFPDAPVAGREREKTASGLSLEQLKKMDSILRNSTKKRPRVPQSALSVVRGSEDSESEKENGPSLAKKKFFKSGDRKKGTDRLADVMSRLNRGGVCLSGPKCESIVRDDDLDLIDDDEELYDSSEKHSIDNLIKQWEEEEEEEPTVRSDRSALENIKNSQSILDSVNCPRSDEAQTDEYELRFVPLDGGYVLMEMDGSEDNSPLPDDLDAIESELEMLDKKIAELAKINNIDPQKLLSATPDYLPVTPSAANKESNCKEGGNLDNNLDSCNAPRDSSKMFPIFNSDFKKSKSIPNKASGDSVNLKRFHSTSKDQYTIDAGQKRFGATQCNDCGVIYQIGDASDEADHLSYHNSLDILKFNGWKTERFCGRWGEGRAIVVSPGDSSAHWQRVKSLLEQVVHPQLGYAAALDPAKKYKVYLYIEKKQIVGCLVAEVLELANKLLTVQDVDCCSTEVYPVKCGVSRIWTHKSHRRKGVATNLMNAMRANFYFGHILACDEIAFSSPTVMGKVFAERYTGIRNFYMYM